MGNARVDVDVRGTNLPESFLIMLRSERTTPYTSFASSSNVKDVLDDCPWPCPEPCVELGGAVAAAATRGGLGASSLTAMTMPVDERSVLRGLPYVELRPSSVCESSLSLSLDRGLMAALTAGRIPPSRAGRGRVVRCQSW